MGFHHSTLFHFVIVLQFSSKLKQDITKKLKLDGMMFWHNVVMLPTII